MLEDELKMHPPFPLPLPTRTEKEAAGKLQFSTPPTGKLSPSFVSRSPAAFKGTVFKLYWEALTIEMICGQKQTFLHFCRQNAMGARSHSLVCGG